MTGFRYGYASLKAAESFDCISGKLAVSFVVSDEFRQGAADIVFDQCVQVGPPEADPGAA